MKDFEADFLTFDGFLGEIFGNISCAAGEDGPLVAITDGFGQSKSNYPEEFERLFEDGAALDTILGRVADGEEPVLACVKDYGIAAGQLSCGRSHRGYVLIGLKGYSLDSMVANMGLVEMLLNQMGTIASLTDRGNYVPQAAGSYGVQASAIVPFCVN